MIKKLIVLLAAALIIIGAFALYQKRFATQQKIYTSQEASQIINDSYKDMNGFSIDSQERSMIENVGGNATYGEITQEGLAQLLNHFKTQLTAQDIFYDLGSGIGKVAVQVALTTPAQAIGIELSPTRHAIAQQIKDDLLERKVLTDVNKLVFIEGNILDANIDNASIIFMCSTCFSEELMQKLSEKIARIPKKVIVLSLKQLPDPNGNFTQGKTFTIPMTWSESTPVHTYEWFDTISRQKARNHSPRAGL